MQKVPAMNISTHSARITQPVPYQTASGKKGNIPVGPCLVEQVDKLLPPTEN